tara:strand:+ start:877 stop:1890 length:1014 start_codon:yes stop_codon:yes gene_type:complete
MNIFYLTLLIILFNLILYIKFDLISNSLALFDKPDGKLKRHSKPASLIGGLFILVNLYVVIFSLNLINSENSNFDNNFFIVVITLSTLFYLVGLIDDLKNLKPNIKLLSLIITIFFVAYLFPEINLKLIKISFLKKTYYFNDYSLFFTILSFLLLANAMNMFDGINLQLILFCLFVFIIFIIKGFLPLFFILFSICFIFLALLNFQNKVFVGDGGCYLLTAILGLTFVYQYQNYDNFLFGDEVFLILLIPALDMLRLFVSRIIEKKHPFKGDLNHLHHKVENYFKNKNIAVFITICLCIFPSILIFFEVKTYNILILNLIIYFSLILFLKIKSKFEK